MRQVVIYFEYLCMLPVDIIGFADNLFVTEARNTRKNLV